MADVQKKRIFIAVELNPELRSSLAKIQAELRRADADVKWVNEENIHITLKFLGHIHESQLGDVFKAADRSVKGTDPFIVSFRGLGAFPDLGKARVVWVGVKEGKEHLSKINEKLENTLSQCGFEREGREYHPHLTLGRVKSSRNRAKLVELIKSNLDWTAGSMRVEKVTVFESILRPEGPEYRIVHVSPLR